MSSEGCRLTLSLTVEVEFELLEEVGAYVDVISTDRDQKVVVGITGSTNDLGSWNPERGMICKFQKAHSPGTETWSCCFTSDICQSFQYRYFVAACEETNDEYSDSNMLRILAWESRLKPRNFSIIDNGTFIQRGWLTNTSELHVRLSATACKFFNPCLSNTAQLQHNMYIACSKFVVEPTFSGEFDADAGFDDRPAEDGSEGNAGLRRVDSQARSISSPVTPGVFSFTPHNCPQPVLLSTLEINRCRAHRGENTECWGTLYKPGDDVTFYVETGDIENTAIVIEFYRQERRNKLQDTAQTNASPLRLIGCARFGPFEGTYGRKASQILSSKQLPIGDLRVQYLVIHPMTKAPAPSLAVTYQHHWKKRKAVDIGHRGMGTSFLGHSQKSTKKPANNKENTLDSFRTAVQHIRRCLSADVSLFGNESKLHWISEHPSYNFSLSTDTILLAEHLRAASGTLFLWFLSEWVVFIYRFVYLNSVASIFFRFPENPESCYPQGADFVEMDVQLTKDHKVVVYHDYEAVVISRKKRGGRLSYLPIAIKDLNYDDLRELKVHHSSVLQEPHTHEKMDEDDLDPIEMQSFPLLRSCFNELDPDLGFVIEVKYPMDFKAGGCEMSNFFEYNFYVDTILREILSFAGPRRILLSCFDPNVCIMLQLKQNIYPVFQLGIAPEYADTRQNDFEHLFWSALSHQLLGVCLESDRLLEVPDALKLAHLHGLVVLAWGEAVNSPEKRAQLSELGVDGIIYDTLNETKERGTLSIFKQKSQASSPEPHALSLDALHLISVPNFDGARTMQRLASSVGSPEQAPSEPNPDVVPSREAFGSAHVAVMREQLKLGNLSHTYSTNLCESITPTTAATPADNFSGVADVASGTGSGTLQSSNKVPPEDQGHMGTGRKNSSSGQRVLPLVTLA
ncbi:glycerophosphodiester phosphodiesterase family protein [Opisthorchis viverrini]|uniref:Glycerophosphodiester phosphodiesterase family protein n=1 Tax=Opisthorchis viverrini TaxID=6198 RepID=A0A1S8WMC4_OPIVI|nr:glycerophosphodiester phosphodiesterase family protein [Opisthorchis viverrini]